LKKSIGEPVPAAKFSSRTWLREENFIGELAQRGKIFEQVAPKKIDFCKIYRTRRKFPERGESSRTRRNFPERGNIEKNFVGNLGWQEKSHLEPGMAGKNSSGTWDGGKKFIWNLASSNAQREKFWGEPGII
jgi:hypothetical protein